MAIKLKHYGEAKSIKEWSEDSRVVALRISLATLRARRGLGWSDEKTLTTPVQQKEGLLKHDGEEKTITEWSRDSRVIKLGLCLRALETRRHLGWADKKILTTPPQRGRLLECYGEEKTIAEWSRDSRVIAQGINYNHIRQRRRYGWSGEKMLTTPPQRGRLLECYGEKKTITEWDQDARVIEQDVRYHNISGRRGLGWSDADVLTTPIMRTSFVSHLVRKVRKSSFISNVVKKLQKDLTYEI